MEWTRYLKALVPAAVTLIATLTQWGVTGEFDQAEVWTAVGGFATAILVYVVPNLTSSVVVARTESVTLQKQQS